MRYKYPRTVHLPWSPGATADDIQMSGVANFKGQQVVVTEKMDGENTTLYNDGLHARSLDSRYHASRSQIKRMHANISHLIPPGWRICGENLYARHSIAYEKLESYFYVFSVWDDQNNCLSWEETKQWAAMLRFPTPPEFYCGVWNEKIIKSIPIATEKVEGYVVRLQNSFAFSDFSQCVAKWVRPNHVTTSQHWMLAATIPNKLRGG